MNRFVITLGPKRVIERLFMGLALVWFAGNSRAEEVIELRGASFAALDAKARRGEPITVMSLGGSITQNGSGHSGMIPDWFQQRYPDSEVEGINAGLSSTCSHTGAFRLGGLLDENGPIDLLVVEYAVNDDQDAAHTYSAALKGMEGIIRRARGAGIATLMVLYVNEALLAAAQKGEAAISVQAHLAVAESYGVPTVNVPVALARAVEAGTMSWSDYGGVHPGSEGYAFAVKPMTEALERALEAEVSPSEKLKEAMDAASYFDGSFVEPSGARYEKGWTLGHPTRELLPVGDIREQFAEYPLLRSDQPGASLTLEFEGTAVGAFVLAGPDAGKVEVRVDDQEPRIVDLYHRYSSGLNYPRTIVFADGLESGKHRLKLKILDSKNEASRGNAVSILYFAVNGMDED